MIINHPLLGPRDASEFTVIGDATALDRPDTSTPGIPDNAARDTFHDYMHLRDNPAGFTVNSGITNRATGHGLW